MVVTSGYLIATTGYFWLLLVPHFSNYDKKIWVSLAKIYTYIYQSNNEKVVNHFKSAIKHVLTNKGVISNKNIFLKENGMLKIDGKS